MLEELIDWVKYSKRMLMSFVFRKYMHTPQSVAESKNRCNVLSGTISSGNMASGEKCKVTV